jgi:hypothetical protein
MTVAETTRRRAVLALCLASVACGAFGDAPTEPDATSPTKPDAAAPKEPDATSPTEPDASCVDRPTATKDALSGAAFCAAADGGFPFTFGINQNAKINGENVNGCVRLDFGEDLPLGSLELTTTTVVTACGANCTNPPCTAGLRVYAVRAPKAYEKVGGDVAVPEGTNVLVVPLASPTARVVVVCRGNVPGAAVRLESAVARCR